MRERERERERKREVTFKKGNTGTRKDTVSQLDAYSCTCPQSDKENFKVAKLIMIYL